MEEPVRVARGELTTTEIIEALQNGQRIIIEVDLLGRSVELALRMREDTYYCDTPVKLLTFNTEDGFRTCLHRFGLAAATTDNQ